MDRPVISSLDIHYASLADIHLPDLSPELNVIYGPNESGKSRIKEFLEWMMFASSKQFDGLSPAAKKAAFRHVDSSPFGSLTLSIQGNNLTFSQQKNNGDISTTLSNSTMSVEDVVHVLTDDISLAHYRNVFSLSLDELTATRSNMLLTEDQVAEVFLSAAQTGSGVSLSALVTDLSAAKDELFSESGNATKRSINKLIREIGEIDKSIRQIRRDQKSTLTFDSEIDSLINQSSNIEEQLNTLNEKLSQSQIIINYFPSYREYEKLSSTEPLEVHADLVSELINIKTLLNQCEHHAGDERELTQLVSTKNEVDQYCDQLERTLRKTMQPETVSSDIYSHEFRLALETEKTARQAYGQDLARTQELFDRDNSELARLTKQFEDLVKNVEVLENASIDEPPSVEQKNGPQPPQNRSVRKQLIISSVTVIVGLLCALISGITGQYFGVAAGVIVTALGAAMWFTRDHEEHVIVPVIHPSMTTYELNAAQRELTNVHSQMEHFQNQVEQHVSKLKELEDERSISRHIFESRLEDFGFPTNVDPSHIEMYLTDLQKYSELRRSQADIATRVASLESWFVTFFGYISRLQELAHGTSCQKDSPITTLVEAQTWLTSLHELAIDHKNREVMLHDTESRTRQLEKILVTQFSNMENARELFSRLSLSDIQLDIKELSEQKTQLENTRNNLNQEIGGLRNNAAYASQETQLQDLLVTRESLARELNFEHEKYQVAAMAYTIAEKAFAQCQRESQPEVLRHASQFLSQATSGRWSNISIGLDESTRTKSPAVRIIVSGPESTLDATSLSQGTGEQLYMSLRLALMQTSARGTHIPALFDDIAVNADRNRFSSIAPLVGHVAQSRQVFYFTCHEWVRDDLVRHAGAHVISL